MKLSNRLKAVASFVEKGSNIADIGTDHGYIPIYLVKEAIAQRAIAMDIRTGPLKRAHDHIKEHGLQDRIETRLSDGLGQLNPGEADTVIIAGMGGELILHILEQGKPLWESVNRWILSPQLDLERVRRYLQQHGFCIREEIMVEEDGKFYNILLVIRGKMEYRKVSDFRYGKILIEKGDPVLLRYLEKEENLAKQVLIQVRTQDTAGANAREGELLEELDWIKEAQDGMQ